MQVTKILHSGSMMCSLTSLRTHGGWSSWQPTQLNPGCKPCPWGALCLSPGPLYFKHPLFLQMGFLPEARRCFRQPRVTFFQHCDSRDEKMSFHHQQEKNPGERLSLDNHQPTEQEPPAPPPSLPQPP
uniref:Uncharacterized protein n=1 Tax=Molossus molossus TaxID=27622 RepID=A0A7J8FSC9_MOLMO|nr:hypothetical protein HJG59_008319 [Molossus molossus]